MFRRWYYRRLRKASMFRFWDGRRIRSADGLALWKRFLKDPTLTDPMILERTQQSDIEAVERFLDAAARLLGVSRYDPQTETGLTDLELSSIFSEFVDWVTQKKTLLGRWRTSSPTSDPPPSSSPDSTPRPSSECSFCGTACD
ncbi:MAG: hypothetical protein Kow0040_17370 [Thermogutta sp.]